MRNTWRDLFQRLAAGCTLTGATAWSSAVCYAVQLAYDTADDPVYSDGWQEGDNGGFGFGPWSFDGTFTNNPTPGGPELPDDGNQQAMDDGLKAGTQSSSPYNDVGRAWTLFNNKGRAVPPNNGDVGTSIARAGRSMPALQVGHTLSVVIDNPTQRFFFRGYNLKLQTGDDANECYMGDNCSTPEYDPGRVITAWKAEVFEYATDGQWQWFDPTYPLFDTDTDTGVRIDFTLTDVTSYSFTMTPLDNTALAVTRTGALATTDPIDWLEFQFYNTDSDFYPDMISGALDTDFYIRSLEITGPGPEGVPGDYNNDGTVNAADYVVWRNGGPLQNEVAGVTPGMVTPEDYTAWQARFGNTSGSGAGADALAAAVPEPSTFAITTAAMGTWLALGRGRSERED